MDARDEVLEEEEKGAYERWRDKRAAMVRAAGEGAKNAANDL